MNKYQINLDTRGEVIAEIVLTKAVRKRISIIDSANEIFVEGNEDEAQAICRMLEEILKQEGVEVVNRGRSVIVKGEASATTSPCSILLSRPSFHYFISKEITADNTHFSVNSYALAN